MNSPQSHDALQETMWERAEIENYFCNLAVLNRYAEAKAKEHSRPDGNDLFEQSIYGNMNEVITNIEQAKATLQEYNIFDKKTNGSQALKQILSAYGKKTKVIQTLNKGDYYTLIEYIKKEEIDPEVTKKLDAIYTIAKQREE